MPTLTREMILPPSIAKIPKTLRLLTLNQSRILQQNLLQIRVDPAHLLGLRDGDGGRGAAGVQVTGGQDVHVGFGHDDLRGCWVRGWGSAEKVLHGEDGVHGLVGGGEVVSDRL